MAPLLLNLCPSIEKFLYRLWESLRTFNGFCVSILGFNVVINDVHTHCRSEERDTEASQWHQHTASQSFTVKTSIMITKCNPLFELTYMTRLFKAWSNPVSSCDLGFNDETTRDEQLRLVYSLSGRVLSSSSAVRQSAPVLRCVWRWVFLPLRLFPDRLMHWKSPPQHYNSRSVSCL